MTHTPTRITSFSAPASTGQTIESDAYVGKVPLVLVFGPDEELLRAFDARLSDFGKLRSQPLAFVRETASTVRELAADHDLTLPILADPDRSIHRRFGIDTTPFLVVVDRDGMVRAEIANADEAERAVDQALATIEGLND